MGRLKEWWKAPLAEKLGFKKPAPPSGADDYNDRYDAKIMAAVQKYPTDGLAFFILKALIRRESAFDPKAESWAEARGLTQLMPGTAKDLGIDDPFDPDQAIDGGAKYIASIWRQFKKEKGLNRWRFALGGYNAGPGYIYQAQRNVAAAGMDPTSWALVANALPTAKVRGKVPHWKETVVYVEKVVDYAFDYYVDAVRQSNK